MWCEVAGVLGVNVKLRHQVNYNSRYFIMCWNCTVSGEYWQFRQGACVLAQWRFRNASTGRACVPSVPPDSDSSYKKLWVSFTGQIIIQGNAALPVVPRQTLPSQ